MNLRPAACLAVALASAGCGSRTGLDALLGEAADASPPGCGGPGTVTLVTRDASTWFGSTLVVDDTRVYWLEHGDVTTNAPGRLMRMDKCGGEPVQLAATANYPDSLVVDGARAYWTEWDPRAQMGALAAVPLGGGTPVTLATRYAVGSLALAGSDLYWADAEAVAHVARSGGPVATLASGQFPQGLVASGTTLAWTNAAARGWWVAVAQVAGGAVTTLAGGTTGNVGEWNAVAADAASAYFAVFAPGYGALASVVRVPLAGGAAATLASGVQPTGIALEGDSLYWGQGANLGSGEIVRVATSGGTPVTVASGMKDVPQELAVDASRVYWTGGSSILSAPR